MLTAYGAFSPKMASIAERFFNDRWIDAPARPGKSPGAFAHPTVPSAHPYVMLNYQGKPRDVMTLAHELGHGVHQVLAAPNGPLMAPTPLTLAETASVFGEMLTFKKLLGRDHRQEAAQGHARRQGRGHDQHGGAADRVLQLRAQASIPSGETASSPSEQLCAIWLEVQRESLGPAIDLRPGYEVFWTYIPHFIHSPFYVYAYAFGDCLVNSLYAVYERASAGFAERYLEMLAAGGTKHHAELLAPFGLDARDPKFWQGGLGVIERMIGELEALDGEVGATAEFEGFMTDREKNRFSARARRYASVGTNVGGVAARMAGARFLGMDLDRAKNAAELAAALGGLKGPIMKVAQLLATIPEALPPEYITELTKLQSQAPPMGWAFVKRRMQAELGADWQTKFASFEHHPAAAASLGQVHRAHSHDGAELACKLQYADMQSAVEADLRQLGLLFAIRRRFDPAIDTTEMIKEIGARMREELDYRHEAKHAALYRDMLADEDVGPRAERRGPSFRPAGC